jgi:hypothetical protein
MNGTTTLVFAALTSTTIGMGVLNGNAPGAAYLQYGALGLCTLMVISAVWCIREVLRHLAKKDQQIQDLIEKDRAERERRE